MRVTTVEAARSTALTTLSRIKGELGIASSDTSQDTRLEDLIEEVSAAVVTYCGRAFARESLTEYQVGYGRTVQSMSLTPIVSLLAVRLDGDAIDLADLTVADPGAGFIQVAGGFRNTGARVQGIEVSEVNQPGVQSYAFDYIGGYVLPGDDITASGICVASGLDSSFNLTGDTFPILVSGEFIRVAGFAAAGNNGRFRVLSREEQKLIVGSTLVDEAPSGIVTIRARNFPRDVEAWVIAEIRDRYLMSSRTGASDVSSERIGDWAATYKTTAAGDSAEWSGLSERTARGLRGWVREGGE
jgi:hypothetical protein